MSANKSKPSRRMLVATGLAGSLALVARPTPGWSEQVEATIRPGGDITTLVNVFAVNPQNQQALVDILKEGTDAFFSRQAGFISSSILSGKSGRQVINYSQWRSVRDLEAFRQEPYFAVYLRRITALASGETIECVVAYVNRA
jgi:hypothetical protein